MELLFITLGIVLALCLIIFTIRIPIIIAKKRGISGNDLAVISILSWVSLLVGITWLIALILSLAYRSGKIKTESTVYLVKGGKESSVADDLERLAELKEKNLLTEEEFAAQKTKILNKNF